MKTLSLKLDDSIFSETEKMVNSLKKTRNRYINEAVDYYNNLQKRRLLAVSLENESMLVREESMLVLHEFESFDYGSQSI